MTSSTGTSRRWLRRVPGIETLVVGALVLFGYRVGLNGVSDNSTFLHLRTGIDMVRQWSIPRVDPYSFTAHGQAWVVQSWLAEAVYGAAYHFVGPHALLIVNGVIAALVAGVVATLARTGSAIRTMATSTLAVMAGALYWAPRPFLFGLLALGLLILVVERRASPWWLLPVGWVWVNTHGSFPLGLAWLVARLVGEALDARRRPRWIEPYVVAFVAALALAAVNPLGPRLLAFPLAVERKSSVFRNVVEWRSPDFQTFQGVATLGCLVLALLILFHAKMRWADTLPVVGFVALGLFSVRNMAPAAVVLAPALATAMTTRRPTDQGQDQLVQPLSRSTSIDRVIAGVLVVAALVFTVGSLRTRPLDFSTYPTYAEEYMSTHGLLDPAAHRVAEQDVVGDYLALLRGQTGRVFIDDRVDMYPIAVSNDYDTLLHGDPSAATVLERYRVDVVLWDRRLALIGVLQHAGGWRTVYPGPDAPSGSGRDKRWTVLVRDSSVAPTS
jgi:hypothetical protein